MRAGSSKLRKKNDDVEVMFVIKTVLSRCFQVRKEEDAVDLERPVDAANE